MRERQPAKRLFTFEILSTHEQVTENGVKYGKTPLGDRVNRVFLVGTLTEVEEVREGLIRLRVCDQSGGMSIWITNKTPELMQKALNLAQKVPTLVAIKGKVRVVNESFTTVRIENISKTDNATRKLWTQEALNRAKKLIEANDDIDPEIIDRIQGIEAYES